MCFSATASFTASVALTGIGVLALRAAHTPGERMFALIPLLFAAQQATEGLVWMSYPWDAPTLRAWATQVYSVFSHLVWPVFIPWAVRALEPVPWRRHVLVPTGGHLAYRSPHFFLPISLTLYLAATTVGLGMSSQPVIRWFGVLALASAGFTYLVYARWFISVWCFYAALLSVMVYIALASRRTAARPAP